MSGGIAVLVGFFGGVIIAHYLLKYWEKQIFWFFNKTLGRFI